MSAVTDFIFGGETEAVTYDQFKPQTSQERRRLTEIEDEIKKMFTQGNPDDLSNLFRQNLTSFMTKDFGAAPTPEQLQQTTSYIDEIFTKPAQAAVQQSIADAQSQAQANAAALGRNPNLDIATQQAVAGEAARQNLGLQQQRGAMIGQQLEMNKDRTLQGLQMGQAGSGFLNDLSQRAFANRLNLLNARSGIGEYYQRERGVGLAGTDSNAGLLGTVANAAGQVAGGLGAVSGATRAFNNFGGNPYQDQIDMYKQVAPLLRSQPSQPAGIGSLGAPTGNGYSLGNWRFK